MIITEELLEAGKNKHGGWSREQLHLIGAADFKTLPDYYWKNRFICTAVDHVRAERFIELRDADEGAYYELTINDRRYSPFPNLMYQGSIAEKAGFTPPPVSWRSVLMKNNLLHGLNGTAALVSEDGTWEEYWEEGALFLIRATRPIIMIEPEGTLLRYRNIAPFEKEPIDPSYRSRSRRLSWNYTHKKIRDAQFIPVDGVKQYRGSKVIQRFKNGFLDGDSSTGSGRSLVKPAYEDEGHVEYWRDGVLHRDTNRPAVISGNGKIKEWWFNGVFIRKEETGKPPDKWKSEETT
jgi:hypothetical protein